MVKTYKTGIDYFSHDVDMSQDIKIKLLKAKHGILGYGIYLILLEHIYQDKGYYLEANEEFNLLFTSEHNLTYDVYINVLNECINRELFNKQLYDEYGILTSCRIQKNYCRATDRRKQVEFIKEYLLIDPKEYYNDNVNVNIFSLNENIKEENEDILPQRKEKESTVQESTRDKVKEHTKKCKDTKKSNTSHSDLISKNPGVPSPYYHLIESFRKLPFEEQLPELLTIYLQLYPSQITQAKGYHPARKSAEKVFKRLLENPGCNDATEILKEIVYWEGSVPTPWDIEKKFPKDGQTFADMKYSMDYAWANQEQHVFNVIEGGR